MTSQRIHSQRIVSTSRRSASPHMSNSAPRPNPPDPPPQTHDVDALLAAIQERSCQVLWLGGLCRCGRMLSWPVPIECAVDRTALMRVSLRASDGACRASAPDVALCWVQQRVPEAVHAELLRFTTDAQRAKYPPDSQVRPLPPPAIILSCIAVACLPLPSALEWLQQVRWRCGLLASP